jgi:hypothetical protein
VWPEHCDRFRYADDPQFRAEGLQVIGAEYKKRVGIRHHDDTIERDKNQAEIYEKCLILLNNRRA